MSDAKPNSSSVFREFFTMEYVKLINYVKQRYNNSYFTASPEDIVQDVALNIFSKLDVKWITKYRLTQHSS